MLPNVLVIGAMKCATSTICAYLERHPDAYFLRRSEPDFFSKDENWAKGVESYEHRFFDAGDCKVVGEGSNSYANVELYPETARRIAQTVPNIKLVYSVRHPIKRVASAWAQIRAQAPDRVSHDINESIRQRPDNTIYPSYYWSQIKAYQQYFSDDQIWVGFLEDLQADRAGFFKSLCSFLEIEYADHAEEDNLWANKTEGRALLDERYSRLRSLPGQKLLKSIAPTGLKRALKNAFSQPAPSNAELVAQLELPEDVAARMRSEASAFLEYAGKPKDFWDF